jgi:hypothetical protein
MKDAEYAEYREYTKYAEYMSAAVCPKNTSKSRGYFFL